MKVHYPKLYNMAHLSLNVFTASKGCSKKMQLMQKLKRLVVQNLDLNLNLYGKRSKLISGSSMIFM